MRTTLDIESDVLQAAKELARKEHSTAGRVISRLVRAGLANPNRKRAKTPDGFEYRNGIPLFPHREGEVITMEHIQNLMDEEGI